MYTNIDIALEALDNVIENIDIAEESLFSKAPSEKDINKICVEEIKRSPIFASFYKKHIQRKSNFFTEEYVAKIIVRYINVIKSNKPILDNITKQSIDKDCKTIVNNLLENDYVMERIGDTLDEQIKICLRLGHIYILYK